MKRIVGPPLVVGTVVCSTIAAAAVPASADTCPNAALRAGQASEHLGDCRAYEQVSPVDKNGGNVLWPNDLSQGLAAPGVTAAAPEGETAMYQSFQAFPGSHDAVIHSYRAKRTAAGWTSTDMTPPITVPNPGFYSALGQIRDASPDLSMGVLETRNWYDPGDQDTPALPLAMDVYLRNADGTLSWESQSDSTPNTLSDASYAGHSGDWRHVLFTTPEVLVPAATGLVAGGLLYDRSGGRTVLVSVNTDGSLINACGAQPGGRGDQTVGSGGYQGAVSSDGTRVVFTSPDPSLAGFGFDPSCDEPFQVYVRDGDETLVASATRRATPDPSGTHAAHYQGASADGSKVLFTSPEALTDTAQPLSAPDNGFLYEFDVPSRTLRLLTPNNPDGSSPDVSGVVAVDHAAQHVYYVTGDNTLRMDDGTASTVVASGTGIGVGLIANSAPGTTGNETIRQARVSADGARLLFATTDQVTSFDNHGLREVYLYDATAGTPLTCVSCNADGRVPLGDAELNSDVVGSSLASRNLLENGTVLFETKDSLVSADTNQAIDVYSWQDGKVALVSDGRAAQDASFIDASEDGRDVFFSTAASLVSGDTDSGGVDVYDSRRGGGFPSSPRAPAACQDDQCQGLSTAVVPEPGPGSTQYHGPGNIAGQPPRPVSTIKVTKPATAYGPTFLLKVRTSGKGAITVSGASVQRAKKTVAKAGSYEIKISLTAKARRRLASSKALRMGVRVAFAPSSGAAISTTVVLTARQRSRAHSTRRPARATHPAAKRGR
jgi:hypothetical protein